MGIWDTAGKVVLSEEDPGPVLVFSGQGSQWAGMCRGLLGREPTFTAAVEEIEPLIAAESGFALRDMLTRPELLVGVEKIQPTLFAVQVALATVWRSWGVRPTAVIGQSMGEVAAAVVAGALPLADGVAVICRRSALLAELTGGAMAWVQLPPENVRDDIEAAGVDAVSIAVLTAPSSTVISGDARQVADLVSTWQAAEVPAQRVNVDFATHSPQIHPIMDRLHQALTGLRPVAPLIRYYSCVTDDPRDTGMLDAQYWVRNERATVRFHGAVSAALHDGHRLYIECSPHPLAVRAITHIARHEAIDNVVAVGSLHRASDDFDAFLSATSAVHCAGYSLDRDSG